MAHRFHWVVLPQGMANSPTLCQIYVAAALKPLTDKCPRLYIFHYIDDILLTGPNKREVLEAFRDLREDVQSVGLVLAPEKIQQNFPYQYLGHQLLQKGIKPLKLQIRLDNSKILNDFQKLLGDINWLRPSLYLGTGQLKPLFDILKGETSPTSLRTLTPEGRKCLDLVQEALGKARLNYIDYNNIINYIFYNQYYYFCILTFPNWTFLAGWSPIMGPFSGLSSQGGNGLLSDSGAATL